MANNTVSFIALKRAINALKSGKIFCKNFDPSQSSSHQCFIKMVNAYNYLLENKDKIEEIILDEQMKETFEKILSFLEDILSNNATKTDDEKNEFKKMVRKLSLYISKHWRK